MPKQDVAAALRKRTGSRAESIDPVDQAYDEMFGLAPNVLPNHMVESLLLDSLIPYAHHPFKPYSEDKLQTLAQSIKAQGLHQPIIVRPNGESNYEILAGHNRVEAFRLNGETHIPAIVTDADDNQAALIVTETNLRQRENLLPSEKAFAYRLQLESMNRQVGRPLTNCVQIGHNFDGKRSREVLADSSPDSNTQIQRYVRLTFLLPDLLQLVDDNKLAFIAAVELSYLDQTQQQFIYQYFFVEHRAKLNIETARYIRRVSDNSKGCNDIDDLDRIMKLKQAASKPKKKDLVIRKKTLAPYMDQIPKDTDLETLFAEFLQERFG